MKTTLVGGVGEGKPNKVKIKVPHKKENTSRIFCPRL